MLVALSSAQRAQTLSKISIDNIVFGSRDVLIPVNSLLKHSTERTGLFSMHLKAYNVDDRICVVECLKIYLKKTASIRGSEKQCFISFCKPFRAVSVDTISRWLKRVLFEAGINVEIFKAHSTRSAATSRAKLDGLSIDSILKTAGWNNNRTFKKYYDKAILIDQERE